ncbi:MAG TPA: hypothetical protein VLD61_02665, partial [Methylomirabilota bacterium]|nr:hypothetical protein [Methylomirabilota bacterium]
HRHGGLGLLTLAGVYHGLTEERVAAWATMLGTAYAAHPERSLGGLPKPPARPRGVDQPTSPSECERVDTSSRRLGDPCPRIDPRE